MPALPPPPGGAEARVLRLAWDKPALGRAVRMLQSAHVNCGERFSTDCELCPDSAGARQCRGDCTWDAIRVDPSVHEGDPRCYRTLDGDPAAETFDPDTQLFISIGVGLGMVVLIIVCCVYLDSMDVAPENAPAAEPPTPEARVQPATAPVATAPHQASDVVVSTRVPSADQGTSVDLVPPARGGAAVAETAAGADAPTLRSLAPQQPMYAQWQQMYNVVKSTCMFGDTLDFVEANPSTVNNRQGGPALDSMSGSGWALLHQAAYWRLTRGLLERFAACGADPLLVGRDGCAPAEVSNPDESAEMRHAWRVMMCEVFNLPPPPAAEVRAAEPEGGGGGAAP